MSMLGDDGNGYELAQKLEKLNVWRLWLGESLHSMFLPCLSSQSSWESFLRSDETKSKPQLQLQLRVRALLFDKAVDYLFSQKHDDSPTSSCSNVISKLNPCYLQLHGDDVYSTLEDASENTEGPVLENNTVLLESQPRSATSSGTRNDSSESEAAPQKSMSTDLGDSWHDQFARKRKSTSLYQVSYHDKELQKRTSDQMVTYLNLLRKHKASRMIFTGDQDADSGNSPESTSNPYSNSSSLMDDGLNLFPETMFMLNCVPETAITPSSTTNPKKPPKFPGIFDALPQSKNPALMEKLGISVDRGGSLRQAKVGVDKFLSQEQAYKLCQKVIALVLAQIGFESVAQSPMDTFSQLVCCHVYKLGRILRVLADTYKWQLPAIKLIKMFLHTIGYSAFAAFPHSTKNGLASTTQPSEQQLCNLQSQPQFQHMNRHEQPQAGRQTQNQLRQAIITKNFSPQLQQQLGRFIRCPAPGKDKDNNTQSVQVKVEIPPDDVNALKAMHAKHLQMQFLQQQQQRMSQRPMDQIRPHPASRFLTHAPNGSIMRAQPVKVEAFQELMGGEASPKSNLDGTKRNCSNT